MAELEVEGVGTFEVEEGERLVLTIEEDARVEIMHACGSYAKCRTCRVAFLEGEPEDTTEAEVMILDMRDLLGRLGSCQIYLDHY
jgi:ferredoxin